MSKSDLLNWLERKNDEWEALLAEVGPGRMEEPGVNGDWTMKDMVAHLCGWDRWVAARLEAAIRGEPQPAPPWPAQLEGDDEVNAWIEAAYQARSVDDVLAEARQTFRRIVAAVASLPDEARFEVVAPDYQLVWVGGTRFQPGESFDHFRDDHEASVRAWLASRGAPPA